MSEEECVACIFGPTLWPRSALLLPTLLLIVGGVLEPSESLSRQLRLSVSPLEPHMPYLAGWGFTMRDRVITCEELVVPFGMDRVAGSPQFIVRINILLLVQVNLEYMCKYRHEIGCRNRRLVCTQQYTKNKGYLLRKGC